MVTLKERARLNTLKDCVRRIRGDEAKVIRLLREDKEYINEIYRDLVEEIKEIANNSLKQRFVNIIGELNMLIKNLNVLKSALPKNHKVCKDVDQLIKRIYRFIKTYQEDANNDLFKNDQEKLKVFLSSMINTLKATVLKDLWEKDAEIRRAIEYLGHLRAA